jgi:hypothetical protein
MANLGTFEDWAERNAVFKRIALCHSVYSFRDDKGLIDNPGPHESNPVQAWYFSELANEGDGENIGDETWFKPSKVEKQIFGLKHAYYAVRTDENGFWYGCGYPASFRRNALKREAENAQED